jgi:hypothetical protein
MSLKQMSFKKTKYKILKKALSKEMCYFLYHYFILKRSVCINVLTTNNKRINETTTHLLGQFNDNQITGSKNCYITYGDIAFDTLLELIRPEIEFQIKTKLIPTYSYARIYEKGNILEKHKDRPSCEISATLNLGGDPWPIFIKDTKNKTVKVNLKPGDMLLYKGCDLEHWREPFYGNACLQVFLHYNSDKKTNIEHFYDGRRHLGLPANKNIRRK